MNECVGSVLCEDEHGMCYPEKSLSSLVSVKSYLLFNLLKIEDLSWLTVPVAFWSKYGTGMENIDIITF